MSGRVDASAASIPSGRVWLFSTCNQHKPLRAMATLCARAALNGCDSSPTAGIIAEHFLHCIAHCANYLLSSSSTYRLQRHCQPPDVVITHCQRLRLLVTPHPVPFCLPLTPFPRPLSGPYPATPCVLIFVSVRPVICQLV